MSWSQKQEYSFGFSQAGITFSVRLLILANTCVFALQLLLDIPFGDVFTAGAPGGDFFLEWTSYSTMRLLSGCVWMPITYMFLHAGLWHLFINMVMLFFFGPEVERVLGSRQFLRFYLFCGVVGVLTNLISFFALAGQDIPIVGASGAILGVLVAFAMIEPDRHVFLIPFPFPITVRALVIIIIAINLLGAAGGGTGVSVATHLGGMAAGFLYMKYRPLLMHWSLRRRQAPSRGASKKDRDKMGKAVDNIFKFQGRKKK